jgi:pantothenate synthetase
MGFLHQGHIELLRVGRAKGNRLIMTIFVDTKPFTEIDYITICDPEKLTDMEIIDRPSFLALAVKVGKARLIDNGILA